MYTFNVLSQVPVYSSFVFEPENPFSGVSGVSDSKETACNSGDPGLISGL